MELLADLDIYDYNFNQMTRKVATEMTLPYEEGLIITRQKIILKHRKLSQHLLWNDNNQFSTSVGMYLKNLHCNYNGNITNTPYYKHIPVVNRPIAIEDNRQIMKEYWDIKELGVRNLAEVQGFSILRARNNDGERRPEVLFYKQRYKDAENPFFNSFCSTWWLAERMSKRIVDSNLYGHIKFYYDLDFKEGTELARWTNPYLDPRLRNELVESAGVLSLTDELNLIHDLKTLEEQSEILRIVGAHQFAFCYHDTFQEPLKKQKIRRKAARERGQPVHTLPVNMKHLHYRDRGGGEVHYEVDNSSKQYSFLAELNSVQYNRFVRNLIQMTLPDNFVTEIMCRTHQCLIDACYNYVRDKRAMIKRAYKDYQKLRCLSATFNKALTDFSEECEVNVEEMRRNGKLPLEQSVLLELGFADKMLLQHMKMPYACSFNEFLTNSISINLDDACRQLASVSHAALDNNNEEGPLDYYSHVLNFLMPHQRGERHLKFFPIMAVPLENFIKVTMDWADHLDKIKLKYPSIVKTQRYQKTRNVVDRLGRVTTSENCDLAEIVRQTFTTNSLRYTQKFFEGINTAFTKKVREFCERLCLQKDIKDICRSNPSKLKLLEANPFLAAFEEQIGFL